MMGKVIRSTDWAPRPDVSTPDIRIRSSADPFVAAMKLEPKQFDRLFLTTRALRRDPDCIEALLLVAEHCEDHGRTIEYLERAVDAGAAHWEAEDVSQVFKGDLSAVPGAHPWLTALKRLGDARVAANDPNAARDCYERLLEQDVADRFQARPALDDIMDHPWLAYREGDALGPRI